MTLEDTLLFDFEPALGERLDLDAEAVSRAIALSNTISEPTHRWSAYLALLALEGFSTWFSYRSAPIPLDHSKATLVEAPTANGAAAITQVLLNQFRVCLIVLDDPDLVNIPTVVIDRPSLRSHFYVAISVHEEQEQISLTGFLTSQQFNQYRQHHPLVVTTEQTYQLPISSFESDFDQLLLYATMLEPNALPLPMIQLSSAIVQFKQRLIQPIVQTGSWIQQQANQLSNELWTLTTPFAPAVAMRSASADVPTLNAELERRGIALPTGAQSAYQDVLVGDRTFRLQVLVGSPAPDRWSFLVLLLAQSASFSNSVQLTIEKDGIVVGEDSLSPQSPYLVAQAEGDLNDLFQVAIVLDTGDTLTLPPFAFEC
jgi:Protein of unknown function (DUF1822)